AVVADVGSARAERAVGAVVVEAAVAVVAQLGCPAGAAGDVDDAVTAARQLAFGTAGVGRRGVAGAAEQARVTGLGAVLDAVAAELDDERRVRPIVHRIGVGVVAADGGARADARFARRERGL